MPAKKGSTKKLPPVTYRPGWNGKAYKGDNWIIANTMIPSRKLTEEEIKAQATAIKKFAKATGKKYTVTKKGGEITISIER